MSYNTREEFPVKTVSREDVAYALGDDTRARDISNQFTDLDMEYLAEKISDAIQDSYLTALDIFAESIAEDNGYKGGDE